MSALDDFIREGRLLRHSWGRTAEDGRVFACLLSAVAPECAKHKSEAYCPAEVMPLWLAYFTTWLNDAGLLEHWEAHVRRYAKLLPSLPALTPRADWKIRRACVQDSLKYRSAQGPAAAVCRSTIAFLDRAIETGSWNKIGAALVLDAAEKAGVRVGVTAMSTGPWAAALTARSAELDQSLLGRPNVDSLIAQALTILEQEIAA